MASVEIFGLCSKCSAYATELTDTCRNCGKHTVQLYLTPDRRPAPWTLDEAAPSEEVPIPQVWTDSSRYSGAGPMTAIVLESIALLLFWPGLISDTVTYAEVPRSGTLYVAILLSVTLSLGSCAALYFGVRARRTDKPGVAATATLFATLGLILSVVIGDGPSEAIARACDAWGWGAGFGDLGVPGMHVACPGSGATFGFPVLGFICWLLATLAAIGTMIGNLAHLARGHLSGMMVQRRHWL